MESNTHYDTVENNCEIMHEEKSANLEIDFSTGLTLMRDSAIGASASLPTKVPISGADTNFV